MDLFGIRRSYERNHLKREDMPANPLELFQKWLQDAVDANLPDPTGMVVATVDETGMPSQRSVLLKKFDKKGFVFFTNFGSRKAHEIEGNNRVGLSFPWYPLERQVHVRGFASKIPVSDVVKYFLSRPKESQIGAWVSHQSSVISARDVLESKFAELKAKFSKGEVPVPSFWGGYAVLPETIEFWQGGKNRLHDRFLYTKDASEASGWRIERLAP